MPLTADDLRAMAEEFAATIESQTGERLDFTPASLAVLDAVLAQWLDLAETYRGDEPAGLAVFTMPVAAYAGEVIVRALGGRWETRALSGEQAAPFVHLRGGVSADVLREAAIVLAGAARPSFARTFASLSEQVSAPDPADAPPGIEA